MRKSEKTEIRILKTVFKLVLPVIAVCLPCVLASPDALCADDDFLITLPGKETKETKPPAVQKTKYPRPNEMLQGVVYDLKRTRDGRSSGINVAQGAANVGESFMQASKKFVLGPWTQKKGSDGVTRYPDLDSYYCLPTRLANSFFYLEEFNNNEAPRLLHSESVMNPGAWIGIWSGYVVAPFSGKFRFVGFGDDQLLVRFNKKIVLDYGWSFATLGFRIDKYTDFRSILSGSPVTNEQARLIQASPFYSSYKLETLPFYYGENKTFGLQRGAVQSVQKGQIIPIEIFIAENGEGNFTTVLFIERLDSNGRPLKDSPEKLPLFRTSAHLPAHPTQESFPDFEEDSPIWKVVDQFGKSIPAKTFAGQNVLIGLQPDDTSVSSAQQTKTSDTTANSTAQAQRVRADSSSMLQGVFYDLKQMRNRQKNNDFREDQTAGETNSSKAKPTVNILMPFVKGKWGRSIDSAGKVHYTELDKYYSPSTRVWNSCFYVTTTRSESMPTVFQCEKEVNPAAWACIYSGYVVAPFDGKFRFLGCADDALVVRFNQQLVLDYGFTSLTLGKGISGPDDFSVNDQKQNQGVGMRMPILPKNDTIYSGKPEVYFPNTFGNRGIAKGVPVNLSKGKVYPVEILLSDIESGEFYAALFIERLDSTGKPLKENPTKLPLFRTSSALPDHPSVSTIPDFDDNSPIWKVVDSKGRPIPVRETAVSGTKKETASETKKTDSGTPASSQEKQTAAQQTSSSQQKQTDTSKTDSSTKKQSYNPFGYTQPLPEDEE